jgi:replicative DNA helicase
MNRQSGDPTALPELWHLRESGTLEADGDLIIQLHRDDYYRWKADPENYQPDHKLVAFVNKNKDGNIGAATLYFDGDGQRVLDWEARPVNGAKSAYAGGVGGTL